MTSPDTTKPDPSRASKVADVLWNVAVWGSMTAFVLSSISRLTDWPWPVTIVMVVLGVGMVWFLYCTGYEEGQKNCKCNK